MKRRERTEILLRGDRQLASRLARQITDRYEPVIMEQPNNGLVMVKMRESARRSLFYLGEVFVTECKVKIGGAIGLGIVKGHEPELAYELAVIDAAYRAGLPETSEWNEALVEEAAGIAQNQQRYEAKVLETKVNFETMDDGD